MEKVFARDSFSSPLSVVVARTSQSPFPLAASLTPPQTADLLFTDTKANASKKTKELFLSNARQKTDVELKN